MAYEPKEWKSGDEITANALNNIEGGGSGRKYRVHPKDMVVR